MTADQLSIVFAARDAGMARADNNADDWEKVLSRVRTIEAPSFVCHLGDGTCWLWAGGTNGSGYGSAWDGQSSLPAHRWSYELLVGPVPEGLELDHLCRIRLCVAPHHLEPVTHSENMLRSTSPDRTRELAAQITHCPEGHPYDELNTYEQGGRRHCRKCMTRRSREWARRNRGAQRDEARLARDAAIDQLEAGSDDWSRAVIDRAIREFAALGGEFDANQVRTVLPDVRQALIGARFMAAARRGEIRKVGWTPSTKASTHGHPITVWIKT